MMYDKKMYQDKDWLFEQYITLGKSSKEIGNELHISYKLVEIWLNNFDIPMKQTFIV